MRTSDNTIRISSSAKQTNSADTIHVIGHRNPDTDAICSAIGYAALPA
jgi:nanoRNase/pAp phosphatase (c-di-AMP/oligoRNAs hydrolase)